MSDINKTCIIDGKEYLLSDVEAMGFDGFSVSAHVSPYRSLFKYYPNTKKYVSSEKKYHNYSFEALQNGTVFLQDAKNFDDCFDCAVDLSWDKFLENRLSNYCNYFDVDTSLSKGIADKIYSLSVKLYEYGMLDRALETIHLTDPIQKGYVELFLRRVFADLTSENKQWNDAIVNAIRKEYDDFIQCLSKFKISCFSTSPYLNRMWSSAYGNNNQGFCIEYEIDVTTEEGRNLYNNIYPVIYSQHRNDLLQLSEHCDLSPTKEDLWQMFFNGLLRKSLHWQDQQEWRLILADGFIDKNPKPFFKIKRIYLGNKMPHKERIKIVNYCRKHTIPYVGLVRDKDSFNLIECEGDCYLCQRRRTEKSLKEKSK